MSERSEPQRPWMTDQEEYSYSFTELFRVSRQWWAPKSDEFRQSTTWRHKNIDLRRLLHQSSRTSKSRQSCNLYDTFPAQLNWRFTLKLSASDLSSFIAKMRRRSKWAHVEIWYRTQQNESLDIIRVFHLYNFPISDVYEGSSHHFLTTWSALSVMSEFRALSKKEKLHIKHKKQNRNNHEWCSLSRTHYTTWQRIIY